MSPSEAPRLLTPEEVAAYLQVPVKTLHHWRAQRTGPPALRLGRHLRYRPEDVETWLAAQADSGTNFRRRGRGVA